jgi:hypothetical protein
LTDSVNIIIAAESTPYVPYSYFELVNFNQELSATEYSKVTLSSSGHWITPGFPNPFNGITHFRYSIEAPGKVSIKVYNSLGQRVETIFEGFQAKKEYLGHWVPDNLPSGTYFIRLHTENYQKVLRVLYIK